MVAVALRSGDWGGGMQNNSREKSRLYTIKRRCTKTEYNGRLTALWLSRVELSRVESITYSARFLMQDARCKMQDATPLAI